MTDVRPPRVVLISHDWTTVTGAGRCATELSALLRSDTSVRMPLPDSDVPARQSGRHPLAKLWRALRVARILRTNRIDVVIVNTTIQATMVVAARLASCRVIWWCHESAGSFSGGLMRARLAVYRRLTHQQIGVSSAVPDMPGPRRLIQNIIPSVHDAPHRGKTLLVLGTKSAGKGTDRLPRLVNGAAGDPTLALAVIGWEDPRDAEMLASTRRQLAGAWGDRLTWRGPVEDLAETFAQTAVLLLPSRAETRPRVVEEALATGIPVVASRLPGLIDILDDVVTPGALQVADGAHEWRTALGRALDLGTSATPYVRGFSSQQFHAAWSVAIKDVYERD